MRTMIPLPYRRPTLTGLTLYSDDPGSRYEILAVSGNRYTALMRLEKKENGIWHKTATLATCPIDRIAVYSDYIEPGPWLCVFPSLPFTVASLSVPLAAQVC